MNKTLSTTLTVLAVLALAAVIFFAGSMYARMNAFGPGNMMSGYGWNNNNSYGPRITGGYGRNNNNAYGPGGMMGNGGNMMNGYGYNNTNLPTLTVDQAKTAAEKYLAKINNSDLKIAEVMVFDNNAYVEIGRAHV